MEFDDKSHFMAPVKSRGKRMTDLTYYKELIGEQDQQVSAVLNGDQSAVILKAHDVGISQLTTDEIQLADQAISRLKESLWP